MDTILFWIAITLLLDAACGLWNAERLQAKVPSWFNIKKIALCETVAATVLLIVRYRSLWYSF